MSPETKSNLESRIRALRNSAQRQHEDAHQHEQDAAYLRDAAKRDTAVADEIQALIDGVSTPASKLEVKLDTKDAMAALRSVLAPGAVLLSPKALYLFASRNRMTAEEARTLLREAGAEFGTAQADHGIGTPEADAAIRAMLDVPVGAPPVAYPHVWLGRAEVPRTVMAGLCPLSSGRYAVPWSALSDEQRIGRAPLPPTT